MYDLSLSPFKFAILSTTSFLLIYGIMQMPVGMIADRYGLKKSLLFATVICSIATILFSWTYQFHTAVIIRILMGFGASFGFICLLVSVYDWMPKSYYGLFIGLSQFIGTMGPMLAAGPLNSLAASGSTDWRTIFFSLGLIGLFIAFLVFIFVKNNQGNIGKFRIVSRTESIRFNLAKLLRQKQIWFIALYSAMVYFSLEYLSENEGKSFIEHHGFSEYFSSYMISVGWLGYALGGPILGFLSDIFKRRKTMMIISALICMAAMIVIVYYPVSKIVLVLAFLCLGVGAAGQSIGFALMAEQCNKTYLAAGLGFNNTMISFLSSVNAPIIGWLLDYHAEGKAISIADYHFAFNFIIGCIAVACIISIFLIKETYCRPTKGFTVIKS